MYSECFDDKTKEFITSPIIPTPNDWNLPRYCQIPIGQIEDRQTMGALLRLLDNTHKDCFIAGGAVAAYVLGKSEIASDIDLYFKSEEGFAETMLSLTKTCKPNSIDLKRLQKNSKQCKFVRMNQQDEQLPLQLIKVMWYKDPIQCIDTFDFTVAQFAVDRQHLYFNSLGMLDLFSRKLVLHRMSFPAATLARMIKYTNKKGFEVCPGSLENIVQKIRQISSDKLPITQQYLYID